MQHCNTKEYFCRACGYEQDEATWEYGFASFELCMCCGIQFGYEDIQYEVVKKYRENWLNNGAKWIHPQFKPQNWNLKEQLQNAWYEK